MQTVLFLGRQIGGQSAIKEQCKAVLTESVETGNENQIVCLFFVNNSYRMLRFVNKALFSLV